MRKMMRAVMYSVLTLVVLLILGLFIVATVSIPIDLAPYKDVVQAVVSESMDREVTIDGEMVVTTSLHPSFRIESIRIANPKGFEGDFASMTKAHIKIDLLALFFLKLHINEFSAQGLSVALVTNKDGTVSWHFGSDDETKESNPVKHPRSSGSLEANVALSEDSFVIDSIEILDASVSYLKQETGHTSRFSIERCTGGVPRGEPFSLDMNGLFLEHPYTARIQGSSLKDLLTTSRSYLDLDIDIVQTKINLAGMFDFSPDKKVVGMSIQVQGAALDSLTPLLGVSLPVLSDYGFKGVFTLEKNRFEMTELTVKVGESTLDGHMKMLLGGVLPEVTAELSSPLIDIKDFLPPDFEQKHAAPSTETSSETSGASQETKAPVKSSSTGTYPRWFARLNGELDIKAQRVVSGQDELGSGSLKARIVDGGLVVDPVVVNIPGGSFFLALAAGPDGSKFSMVAEDFDFGIIAHMYDPKTNMGGLVNVDVRLESKAKLLKNILAEADGYIDFVARLKNIHAGIVDLWAVNLMTAILSKNDGGNSSEINCAVAQMNMKGGQLSLDVFAIDTTAMRICGRGSIDFKKRRINMEAQPSAKTAEYFSLATPLAVDGSFDDFSVGIARGGIFGTVINFITSPIHATARRLGGKYAMPPDGSDVCSMPIGIDHRPTIPPKGCRPNPSRHKK